MNYLIFGNGWIAGMIKKFIPEARIYTDRISRDNIIDSEEDVWINTIGKTNIDWCEKNRMETLENNTVVAGTLAQIAYEKKKKYVFISSACIFESENLKDVKYEDSMPNPRCFYSTTKVMAENLIKINNPLSLIIRIRLPISEVPHPRNTLTKLLKYPLINDAQESVTVIEDMIPLMKNFIEENIIGVRHIVNPGTISPAEMAILLGHNFTVTSKKEQDERLLRENRAKRITAIIGTHYVNYLPDIKQRILEVVRKYQNG